MWDHELTLYKITNSGDSYTFNEIKWAVNKAIKKEDGGGYSYLFMKNLREFNLKYLCKDSTLDETKRYKLCVNYCKLEIIEEIG